MKSLILNPISYAVGEAIRITRGRERITGNVTKPISQDSYATSPVVLNPQPVEPLRASIIADAYPQPYTSPLDLDNFGCETGEMRRLFRKLFLTEPTLGAAVEGLVNSIADMDVNVIPDDEDNDDDKRAAEFVQWTGERSAMGWDGMIRRILTPALVDGWSACEKVFYGVDDGRKFAGLWGLDEIRTRDTAKLRLRIDTHRNVLGIVNLVRGVATYSPRKVVIYTHNEMYDNPHGNSEVRACFRACQLIENAYTLWFYALTAYSGPFLVGKTEDPARRQQFQAVLEKARAGGFVVVPKEDELDLLNLASASNFDAFKNKIDKLREEIFLKVRGGYLPFMQGGGSTGGDVRGDSKVSKGSGSDPKERMIAKAIGRTMSRQIAADLTLPNFGPRVGTPRIILGGTDWAETKAQLDVLKSVKDDFKITLSKKSIRAIASAAQPADDADTIQPSADPPGGGDPFAALMGGAGGGNPPGSPPGAQKALPPGNPKPGDGNPDPGGTGDNAQDPPAANTPDKNGNFFSAARTTFAAPGAPPRPNLAWKESTHRWINPHTGEEHDHVTGEIHAPTTQGATAARVIANKPPDSAVGIVNAFLTTASHGGTVPPHAIPTLIRSIDNLSMAELRALKVTHGWTGNTSHRGHIATSILTILGQPHTAEVIRTGQGTRGGTRPQGPIVQDPGTPSVPPPPTVPPTHRPSPPVSPPPPQTGTAAQTHGETWQSDMSPPVSPPPVSPPASPPVPRSSAPPAYSTSHDFNDIERNLSKHINTGTVGSLNDYVNGIIQDPANANSLRAFAHGVNSHDPGPVSGEQFRNLIFDHASEVRPDVFPRSTGGGSTAPTLPAPGGVEINPHIPPAANLVWDPTRHRYINPNKDNPHPGNDTATMTPQQVASSRQLAAVGGEQRGHVYNVQYALDNRTNLTPQDLVNAAASAKELSMANLRAVKQLHGWTGNTSHRAHIGNSILTQLGLPASIPVPAPSGPRTPRGSATAPATPNAPPTVQPTAPAPAAPAQPATFPPVNTQRPASPPAPPAPRLPAANSDINAMPAPIVAGWNDVAARRAGRELVAAWQVPQPAGRAPEHVFMTRELGSNTYRVDSYNSATKAHIGGDDRYGFTDGLAHATALGRGSAPAFAAANHTPSTAPARGTASATPQQRPFDYSVDRPTTSQDVLERLETFHKDAGQSRQLLENMVYAIYRGATPAVQSAAQANLTAIATHIGAPLTHPDGSLRGPGSLLSAIDAKLRTFRPPPTPKPPVQHPPGYLTPSIADAVVTPQVRRVGATDAEIARVGQSMFGNKFKPELLDAAASGFDGMTLTYEVGRNEIGISGRGPGGTSFSRTITKRADGTLHCENYCFFPKKADLAGKPGTEVMFNQMKALKALGVTAVSTNGCGNYHNFELRNNGDENAMIGYYVWPTAGYDGTISSEYMTLMPDSIKNQMRGKRDFKTLYEIPNGEGKAWWKTAGKSNAMNFDLRDGSDNIRRLTKYITDKRKSGKDD